MLLPTLAKSTPYLRRLPAANTKVAVQHACDQKGVGFPHGQIDARVHPLRLVGQDGDGPVNLHNGQMLLTDAHAPFDRNPTLIAQNAREQSGQTIAQFASC